jgi:hypothetical protein
MIIMHHHNENAEERKEWEEYIYKMGAVVAERKQRIKSKLNRH